MFFVYMKIDNKEIESLIEKTSRASQNETIRAIETARKGAGLSLMDAGVLLQTKDPELLNLVYLAALEVKKQVFGSRIVFFAPLYLSNHCTNGCVYCGFRSSNSNVERKALDMDEVQREAAALERMGFKRLLLVIGEDPRFDLDYIISCIRAIYDKTGIRIVHVNAAPMDIDGLKRLKSEGVGVYQTFQETYHRPTYEKLHPWGKKKDYDWRLDCMDRAITAGFEDVGIGALLGLYDFRFDVLSTIAHSKHLYERFSAHAHTISIPRLRPAEGSLFSASPWPVTDEDMKRIASVYRLAIPSAGVVVSTREPAGLRDELLFLGASQLSAASSTTPGGYLKDDTSGLEQFTTSDRRSLDEVMTIVAKSGLMPSLCTACYRSGRVGADFTKTAMNHGIGRLCGANALLTLKEYVLDLRGNTGLFETIIENGIRGFEEGPMKKELLKKMTALEQGQRDLFF
ncbi:MAG: [FeFe] hydrogenase H-cluster radical SAM maturase HydG [Deltaproteobacteria bacterium]|nr:[FeFe] hydrogenase H-cluster radical SAM maturase HydG [Deltaproteobacteria bacterium]